MARKRTKAEKIRAAKPLKQHQPSKVAEDILGYEIAFVRSDILKTLVVSGVILALLLGLAIYIPGGLL